MNNFRGNSRKKLFVVLKKSHNRKEKIVRMEVNCNEEIFNSIGALAYSL